MLGLQLEILQYIKEHPRALPEDIAATLQERRLNDTEVRSQGPLARVVSQVVGLFTKPHGKVVAIVLWELEVAHYIVRPWHPDSLDMLVHKSFLPPRKYRLTEKGHEYLRKHAPQTETSMSTF